jgi:mRNA interferase MazF
MAAKPGEVWLADLGLAAKTRPVIILSRDDADAPRALVTYVPLTTQNRRSRYEIDVGNLRFLREASVANVQGIGSIPSVRLQRKIGVIPADILARIKEALRFALDF